MKFLNIILIISIAFATLFGDYMVFNSKYSKNYAYRAFSDNSVHGAVGFLSSLLFFSHKINVTSEVLVYNVVLCTAVSSLIDVDHFIAARSFRFADIANLNQQGIFHCLTLWVAITIILLTYSQMTRNINVFISTFMLMIAFTSHLIRDGNRRGLWLPPYGHTAPLNKYVYISLTCVLPLVLAYVCSYYKPLFKDTVVSREIV